MKIGALIQFEVWRNMGKDRKNMTAVLKLEPDMLEQIVEAANCPQPAGVPEQFSKWLEEIARKQGWHFDYIRNVLVGEDLLEKVRETAIFLANGGGMCDICVHGDICKENDEDCDLQCEHCARIAGTACKECVKSKDWKNFRWNGTAGPEEALHE